MNHLKLALLFLLGGCADVAGPQPGPSFNRDYDLGFAGHVEGDDLGSAPDDLGKPSAGAHDLAGPTAAACHLVINEVQTGDSATATAEFVEVFNPCTSAISLNGWKLVYRAASNTSAASAGDSSTLYTWANDTLAAGGYRVYGGSGWTGQSSGAMIAGIAASGAVGIRNASGALIDSVAFGTATGSAFAETAAAMTPPVVAAPGNSIARMPNGTDSDDNSTDFAKSSHATPGAANL